MNANLVIVGGNITRDVRLTYTPTGKAVAQFGVATNRRWRDAKGEKKEAVTFVDCIAWGKTAETISRFFTKGKAIYVEGRLQTESWQDKETKKNRSKLVVNVDTFQFVGGPKEGSTSGSGDEALDSVPFSGGHHDA